MAFDFAYYNDVLFNSVDLTELSYIKITRVGIDRTIENVLFTDKLARSDGGVLYGKEYSSRIVEIEGLILADSRQNFLSARDTLLKNLQEQEATLQVPYDNNPIEFTATMQNIIFNNVSGGYGSFVITFICSDPFGYDRDARTIVNGLQTTASSDMITYLEAIGGSYKTPIWIRLVVNAVSGGTSKYIDLANQAGNNIRITRTWTAGDTIIIDMKLKTCYVNGVTSDYSGNFWEAEPGDTSMTYSDNFDTSRTVNIIATYKRRRL